MRHRQEHLELERASNQRVSIRFAGEADAERLEWVAQRDTKRVPGQPMIVAELDGRILAARSLAGGATIADPFTATANLVDMLEARAAQLAAVPQRSRRPLAALRERYAHA